ncbi:MAG: hypothetical protein IT177_11465 [Acidobacteria bacterium]|nr:hypothetical protein [Acidobacteriota bacterium]
MTGAALLLAVSAVEASRAQATSASALAWMAGSWAGADGRVEHEEHWTAPKGGAMVGMHRTIRDGRMVEFEFLRIEEQKGGLVYLSMPNGRSPATPFTLKTLEGQRVVFENLAHDFPQRVIYWLDGDDLRARIEGTANGKERSMEWRWSRAILAP